ncbi:MAG: hypothetical protein QW347_06120 [Candidatus Nitrosocaldus sp.]
MNKLTIYAVMSTILLLIPSYTGTDMVRAWMDRCIEYQSAGGVEGMVTSNTTVTGHK